MSANGGHIGTALRIRYPGPEWALFFEVANGTGAHTRRYADAVAMNLFPSRGLEIHGFEFKTSRADWLREIKNPSKAEAIFKYCDRWWIVAWPDTIREGELPPTWGHIEFKNGKLRQVTAAPRLEPEPLSRSFVAAMMRRAGQADADTLRTMVNKEVVQIRANESRRAEEKIAGRLRDQDAILKRLAEIKALTGIDLLDWTPTAETAEAIRFVLASKTLSPYTGIKTLRDAAERFVATVDKTVQGAAQPTGELMHG